MVVVMLMVVSEVVADAVGMVLVLVVMAAAVGEGVIEQPSR